MQQNYKIVFSLVETKFYGFIIEAYRATKLKNGLWSLDFKKIKELNCKHLNFEITDEEKSVLNLLYKTSDKNILNQFSLLKTKKQVFGESSFSKNDLQTNVIPWVSRQTYEIITKIFQHNLNLFYYNANKAEIDHQIITKSELKIEPHFQFNLENETFYYKLILLLDNKAIDISQLKIISTQPCLVLLNNTIYSLPKELNGNLIKPFCNTDTIIIPTSHTEKYLETFVRKIVRQFKVDVSGFSVITENHNPKPILNIAKIGKNDYALTLDFEYGDYLFSLNNTNKFVLKLEKNKDGYIFIKCERNISKELEYINSLIDLGYEKTDSYYFSSRPCSSETNNDLNHILNSVSTNSKALLEKEFCIAISILDKKYIFNSEVLYSKIEEKNDWFDLKIKIRIGNFDISFVKFIPYILKNNNEFVLPDNTIFYIPDEWFSRFKDLVVLSEKKDDSLLIRKSQFSLLDNIDLKLVIDNRSNLLKFLKSEQQEFTIPKLLKAELRDYQKKGVEWLWSLKEHSLGGCLADDMGLGKTIQILAYFLKLKEIKNEVIANNKPNNSMPELFDFYDDIKPYNHLIIAPLSVINNWNDEIKKFAPSITTATYIGNERSKLIQYFKFFDVVITSYGIIRNDFELLKNFNFHTIILDESQNIKNPQTKSFDAILSLSSKQRFILTGTPLENSLTDLWSQLTFLNRGILGNYKKFKESYALNSDTHNNIETINRIKKIISPFILRRTKQEVIEELPDLSIKICYCEMSDAQKNLYETKKNEIRNFLLENGTTNIKLAQQNKFIVLSGLMKLRIIANHPLMNDSTFSGFSGKFEEIKIQINKVIAEGHKTIIFSQFVKQLNIIRDYLDLQGIKYVMLTGKTSVEERKQNISKFRNDGETKIFLMSLKAGGVGLNLTEADYVFMLDLWWNPSVEMQAISRTHRIGQDKKVMVYKFITTDSIEEKILNLQDKKMDLFENVISNINFSKLNAEELIELI